MYVVATPVVIKGMGSGSQYMCTYLLEQMYGPTTSREQRGLFNGVVGYGSMQRLSTCL